METLLGSAILGCLVLYALLGGADFGGGFWDLVASGPRRPAQRALIAHALAPVWEVNHVWLIVAWVLLFTGFPRGFALLGGALHVPLTLFLLGVVGRGSAFAFRAFDSRGDRVGARWGLVFSVSSLLSPLLLGAIVGAVASGRVERGWLSPFTVLCGLFALALFSFLAAVYLCAETVRPELAEDFRRRALGMGAAVATLAAAVLLRARSEGLWVAQGLTRTPWALALHLATGLLAVTAFAALWRRRYRWARVAAAGQVALIILGWGFAQYPYLIVPQLTLAQAAAHPALLRLTLAVLPLGALVLVPSLWLLFRVFKARPAP